MESSRLKKQIEFIKEVDKLKYIERKTRLFNSNRRENDAEHSWHLSLMAIILDEHSNENIDVLKVLKMLLIHDIVEIDAGDTFLFDTKKNHDNTAEEFVAAKRIFGILPKNQAEDLIAIWKEFEEGETSEAKFAKAMDRFQPVLQNQSNNGGTWFEFNVIYENVIKKTEKIKLGSSTIWEYVEKTIKSLYNR
ncbi:HD domain-containing protein [Aureibaculum algae]|uniref:HD domain-containing protein n=1 Tax=Aureibaculum algae TaxID=2584122 RepID=A0A5B7TSW2_9FLAO|nr:HD domain-containing protein [Aureibaculum algae]QCX39060.1 HD domain-containing protein [Aureibaculum algae]QCX39895.1 HD domain-containing protein [Aureibaculum algae]